MIKFVIARHNEDDYKNYLEPSISMMNVITYDVSDKENESLSLTQKYNSGIEVALKDGIDDEDIIVFSHEDVKILDQFFCEKLNMVFLNKPDVGLVGVIGTKEFLQNGMWWANTPDKLNGHIVQENNNKEFHLVKGKIGYFDDIVAIDGLIFAIRGKLINEGLLFDENFKFHHYDIDMCFQVLKRNYKIAIADILVKHKSAGLGSLTDEYKESKTNLINKWSEHGFPITVNKFRS